MSITGDLKSFPIIDIIQLLHGTRNSGVLRISGEKGESQLVFHNGDLVSANYLNGRVRIGQVLVSAGAISDEQLTQALEIQKNAGKSRKPLILTLLEHNMIDEAEAYSGIEALIEMTIVEALTWKSGRFALDMAAGKDAADDYHYSPAKFQQQILLNAQGVVMESLRIFDEKMRSGTMDEILSIAGITNIDLDSGPPDYNPSLSGAPRAADKIASSLQLFAEQRKKILSSGDQGYRAPDVIKRLVVSEFPEAPKEQKQLLASIFSGTLQPAPVKTDAMAGSPSLAVVVITKSQLLSTMIKAVCHQENIYAISSEDNSSIDISIRLLQCQNLHPVIMIDLPHADGMSDMVLQSREYLEYRQTSAVIIACSRLWEKIGLSALASGVRSIIPRPCRECTQDAYAQQAITFCSELGAFLKTLAPEISQREEQRFFTCISSLRKCKTRLEISEAVLTFMSDLFERAIVFNIAAPELIAELSFGINSGKDDGQTTALSLKIPVDDQPIFQEVIATGQLYYGFHSDSSYQHKLYSEIGAPENPEVLLFPLVRANRVVAVIYADFGSKEVSTPTLSFLEALLQYTTAQISVTAYRQKLKSMLEASAKN